MSRNSEYKFGVEPQVNIKRSIFDLSYGHKTTFNTGDLVPIMVQEVLPGDTFNVKTNYVIRTTTPIKPVMDVMYCDLYYFFVPNRLVWEHWEEFMGENKDGAWTEDQTEYNIPGISFAMNAVEQGSALDHMGVPINIKTTGDEALTTNTINALPVRGYGLIWNEYFRDENIIPPIKVPRGDSTMNYSDSKTNQSIANTGNGLFKVAKFHDYFTSALPGPQKGDPVTIGIGGQAPILTGETDNSQQPTNNLRMKALNPTPGTSLLNFLYYDNTTGATPELNQGLKAATQAVIGSGKNQDIEPAGDYTNDQYLVPTNLYADLSQATSININDLRMAFQVQKLLERDARGGTRYIEIIKAHFGVTSSDARMQRPEYLGGKRFPINMAQVLQTSSTNEESPQGNTSAFSLTGGTNQSFTKSFTEHGYIIGLACVRTIHSYQQGLNKLWSRKRRFDFYWPALANIGEQPILNKEIYYQGGDGKVDNEVFGYMPAWTEYRKNQNIISGEMRSTAAQPLDIWHYGDKYETLPTLSEGWLKETTANVDRTLAVQSSNSNQILADFYFKIKAARPMPTFSIPGLIDHN